MHSKTTPNKAQQEIIDRIDGATLAMAGPGSGKTNTLKHKVLALLESKDHQIDPGNMKRNLCFFNLKLLSVKLSF